MLNSHIYQKVFFVLGIVFCLSPLGTPATALASGLILAIFIGNPFQDNKSYTAFLLQASVVGLGFGMNIGDALDSGKTGLIFTFATILGTLVFGYFLGKWLKTESKVSHLISCGTAICGGSAIAAIAPIIKADKPDISIALGTIFILNSVALFLFPVIGHYAGLSAEQFGTWCAIAIHDTSSVVGAASKFGESSLHTATTIKLARALWIIPLAFGTAFAFKNRSGSIKIPYFIGYFLIASFLSSYIPSVRDFSPIIVLVAKKGLVLTLFLIGSSLSREALKKVGLKPLLQGIILWICISLTSLVLIMRLQ